MNSMHHRDPPTPSVAPQPSRADARSPAWATRLLNRQNALLGGLVLVLLVWHVFFPGPPNLLVIAVVLLASELLLTVYIDDHRPIRLSTPFAFIAFLTHGAVAAAVLQAGAWAIAQIIRGSSPNRARLRLSTILSGTARQLLYGFVGGLAVWFTLGISPLQPPAGHVAPLVIYVVAYLFSTVAVALVGTALRTGQHEVPSEVGHDSELWRLLAFLLSAPAALFVLNLQSRLGFAIDLLLAFALLAAVSYSAQLHLRLNAIVLEYTVLNEISRSLSGSLDLNKLYPAIYSRVRRAMPADVFMIGLLNEEQTKIDVPFLVENGELLTQRAVRVPEAMAEMVLRTGKALYFPNGVEQMPHVRVGQAGREAAAIVFVPLCVGDDAIGVLSAQSYTAAAYTPERIALLEAIGRIGAVAINNARLFAREKEVLRGREEFISLVAHELKNPLAALLGHAQILERRLRQFEDKLRRPITIIQEQGERMNRLVEDLLDLSRADSGRLALHLQPLDLLSLTHDVAEQHRILTTQHQIVVMQPEEIPPIEGDALRLTQVLQNLLSNAIKYSPQGGQITIRVEVWGNREPGWPQRLRKTIAPVQCWAVVRVSDEGIGVPPDQLGRIFERFYRANNTAHLGITGTGLGLSICEGLVRAHGGVIWADSEWGVGSTFSFALPLPIAAEQ